MTTMSNGRARRSEGLVADILDMIQSGVVRPGAKLPTEAELCERFDVSRTVVREAIAQLRSAGIVRSAQGRGTFVLATPASRRVDVTTAGADDLAGALELLEFRTAIEVGAAGLAAARRTAQQLAGMATALEQFRAAEESPAAAVDADFAFHLWVARAAANVHFVDMIESLGTASLAIPRARLRGDAVAFRRAYDEHAAIHDAISAHDALGAAAAMRAHLTGSAHRLRAG